MMKYVCELCGMIYDEQVGDPKHKVRPGTAFAELPEYYECPRCGSEKEAFSPVRKLQPTGGQAQNGYWNQIKYSDHNGGSDR